MRNYWTSDYAVNKGRGGLVYQFADGSEVEISLADYLQDNPEKTEQDFMELKTLSDEIYHNQDLEEARYGRRARTLESVENSERYASASPDVELIHKQEAGQALKAAKRLMAGGNLTEVQRRRFILHFFQGMSIRQIAHKESVHKRAIWDSLQWAEKKLKKFFRE